MWTILGSLSRIVVSVSLFRYIPEPLSVNLSAFFCIYFVQWFPMGYSLSLVSHILCPWFPRSFVLGITDPLSLVSQIFCPLPSSFFVLGVQDTLSLVSEILCPWFPRSLSLISQILCIKMSLLCTVEPSSPALCRSLFVLTIPGLSVYDEQIYLPG